MSSITAVFCCLLFVCLFNDVIPHGINFTDRDHLKEHVQGELDLSFVSDEDLQYLYFQSHDTEANNKLDGCELVQSLLHFRSEESAAHGETTKPFTDDELSTVVDSLLDLADANKDGFIDFSEFVTGQAHKRL